MTSQKFTKEQLLAKDENELRAIAATMNLPERSRDTPDDFIYDILDAQADEMNSSEAEAAPRRKRISVRATDHVYTASKTGESERFDSAKDERAAKRAVAAKALEADALATQALLGLEALPEPPKRKRGRPSKEEIAARKAFEEMKARQEELLRQAQASMMGTVAEMKPEETDAETVDATATTTEPAASLDPAAMFGVGATPEPAAPVAEQSATNPSAETPVPETADLPDFIVAQMQQQAVPTPAPEQPAVQSLADLFKQRSAEAPQTHAPQPTDESRVPSDVAALAAEGADFIIVSDIPVVDNQDFSFDATPEPAPSSMLSPADNAALNRFRCFKDEHMAATTAPVVAAVAGSVAAAQDIIIEGSGVLEIDQQGIGFLRSSDYNYMPSPDDIFVSQQQIRNNALKMGDVVECKVKVPREGEKYFSLVSVERINGFAPHEVRDRVAFEHLTPLFPNEQFKLSKDKNSPLACRVVDLFSPIGKGQRALIVAQPKTGKTILMKQIANAIAANYPDTYLMMLLVDERPEEVTDMARTVNAEVIASTFDEPAARHVRIAQMVLEKAKRMVECGHDVVIFLDSITRLARAFNTVAPASGKILTGGVDANALQKPKRFFGAARNIENGGSLTIIATALIDTGSKMDEVIFEEFKGTGNMELQLDRSLANKRIFPAVNLIQSSTRRDDLLHDETTLSRMYLLRNFMADMSSMEAMEFVKKRIESTISNDEFLMTMNR